MSWPLSQDYNEAIQSPASNFTDPDLRRGEAATNKLGLPMPFSGNFADVYQVRCPDGSRWAVKCFTREAPGLRERYHEISRHLRSMKLPFIVDFTYLEQGIRVVGKWYPVLKMEWVEGLTLNQFVGKYADNPVLLEALLHRWGRVAKYLRAAKVGHCDLQHGNVLLTQGANAHSLALKLIDYDGMWVPALAGTRSGEVGHACYQHPQRLRDQSYSIDVDRFPLLLIATALRALKVKGRLLWDKYDNGDNLLFKEADLLEPLKSHLFLDLTKTGDPLVSRMMDLLVKSLRGSLETVPLLEEVMPEATGGSSGSHPALRESGATGKHVSAIQTPKTASAAPVASSSGGDMAFDFGEPAPAAPGGSSSRLTPGNARRKAGPPVWAWVASVSVLVVALGVTGAAFIAIQSRFDNPPGGSPVAQTKPIVDPNKGSLKPVTIGGPTPPPAPPPPPIVPPPTPSADAAWLKAVAALPPDGQVQAVADELKKRNPGFDGKVTPIVENGVVVGLVFLTDEVTDIAPVRALVGLRTLNCNSSLGKGRLADLSPLKDMKLTTLMCFNTQVSDLSPLKGMPLTFLGCANTQVSDLSPLKGMPLRILDCDFKAERDADILRSIQTLVLINNRGANVFWQNVNAKEPEKKPEVKEQKTIKTPSGLQYVELQVGTGKEAKSGDTVTVNYVATLKDGKKFDSTGDRNLPFTFQIGKPRGLEGITGPAQFFRCWDEAVTGMKEGGKRELTIPPDLGFGAANTTVNGLVIPPNSELHLEVEFVKVK